MKDTTDHIVDPTYDYRSKPWFEHGDEAPSNWSANPTFYDVVEARLSRRGVLAGGIATAVASVFTAPLGGAARADDAAGSMMGFEPVMMSTEDTVVVPPGYTTQVLIPSGTPIMDSMPAFSPSNTGEEQGMQVGMHHDGMHFFPVDGSSTDGYLVLNHEYIEPRFLHGAWKGMTLESADSVVYDANGRRDDDEVLKEVNAHGVSVVRSRGPRTGPGAWSRMRRTAASPAARRWR